jgi:hypothetical protein
VPFDRPNILSNRLTAFFLMPPKKRSFSKRDNVELIETLKDNVDDINDIDALRELQVKPKLIEVALCYFLLLHLESRTLNSQ